MPAFRPKAASSARGSASRGRSGAARGSGRGLGAAGAAVEDMPELPWGSEESEADLMARGLQAADEVSDDEQLDEDVLAPNSPNRAGLPGAPGNAHDEDNAAAGPSSLPASRASGKKKTRTHTEVVFELEHGSIRFYPKSNVMQAFCRCAGHLDDCRKGRTTVASEKREFQKRPLGYLASWLQDAADYSDKASHCHLYVPPSFAKRQRAREYFLTLPGAADFAAHERPRQPGEPAEPATFQ